MGRDLWVQWHGVKLNSPDWGSWSNTISYTINKGNEGPILWIVLNAYHQSMKFELPKTRFTWVKILDTNCLDSNANQTEYLKNQKELDVSSQSFVLAVAKEYSKGLNV